MGWRSLPGLLACHTKRLQQALPPQTPSVQGPPVPHRHPTGAQVSSLGWWHQHAQFGEHFELKQGGGCKMVHHEAGKKGGLITPATSSRVGMALGRDPASSQQPRESRGSWAGHLHPLQGTGECWSQG